MAEGPEWARLTDQEVVLLARGGREAAYRELVRRYERPVFALGPYPPSSTITAPTSLATIRLATSVRASEGSTVSRSRDM